MSLEQTPPPIWGMKHLRAALDAAEIALWSWDVDTDEITMDERAYDLWGLPHAEHATFERLSGCIHPEDLDRVRAEFAATRAIFGSYETDFRILVDDEIRWISARGQGSDEGIRSGVMFGVFLNVTQRKQAEEANELLAGEMSHRVKNLLQVASALAVITGRSATTTEDMIRDLTNRLTALGRAHDLVRSVSGQETKAALLGDMLSVLLVPYDNTEVSSRRIRVSVPRLGIGEAATMPLAMVVHELATNSLKYGALSATNGTVDVSGTIHGDDVVIFWAERGGPPVVAPAAPAGFGSKMITRSISRDLNGSIAFDWSKEGLVVTLRINAKSLTT